MHCVEDDLQELTGSLHFACCRRGKQIKYHVFKLYLVEKKDLLGVLYLFGIGVLVAYLPSILSASLLTRITYLLEENVCLSLSLKLKAPTESQAASYVSYTYYNQRLTVRLGPES